MIESHEVGRLSKLLFDWGPWFFNLGLVMVGSFQVWLLNVTWKTIRLQATLQEAGTRPWVKICNWRLSRESPRNAAGELRASLRLQYAFKIVNKTSLPVSIRSVSVKLMLNSSNKPELYEMDEEFFIPPDSPDEGVLCLLPVNLFGFDIEAYEKSKVVLHLSGSVSIVDAKGGTISQNFHQLVQCGPEKNEEYIYLGKNLQRVDGVGRTGLEDSEKPMGVEDGGPILRYFP